MPVKSVVHVEIEGHAIFTAEVELRLDNLDAQHMPLHVAGIFTKLPSGSEIDIELANTCSTPSGGTPVLHTSFGFSIAMPIGL